MIEYCLNCGQDLVRQPGMKECPGCNLELDTETEEEHSQRMKEAYYEDLMDERRLERS